MAPLPSTWGLVAPPHQADLAYRDYPVLALTNMIECSTLELRKNCLLLPALLIHWNKICPFILDIFPENFLWNFSEISAEA